MPAQNMPSMPKDASVVSGALANGISYYLVTNPAQKGFADFSLVWKGCTDTLSAREGLSSLPHFNKTIPHEFLSRKNIGCRPEGYISYRGGSTIFSFDDVPVFDQAASDTTLLMLFDLIAVKPCQATVVIAGDITPAPIIEKMKVFSLMVPSRAPSYAKPAYSFTGGDSFGYSFKPEKTASLTVDVRAPRTPDAQMPTLQPFMSELFCRELGVILRNRLKYSFVHRSVPVSSIDVSYLGSAGTLGDEHFTVKVSTGEEHMIPASMAVASVLSETAHKGVGPEEYQTARDVVYRQLLKPQTNRELVEMCISSSMTGSDLALTPSKVKFFSSKTMNTSSEHSLFSNYVSALLGDTGCMSVRWTGSEEDYDEWTSTVAFSSAWKTVSMLDEPSIKWKVSARDSINLRTDKNKTKYKGFSPDAISKGEVWSFANGVKVAYKKDQSDKGRFSYSLMVKGGYGAAKGLRPGEGAFFSDIMSLANFGFMLGPDFERLMMINGIDMQFIVNPADVRIQGSAPTGKLQMVLKALLTVTNQISVSKATFDAYKFYEQAGLKTDKLDSLMYPDNLYPKKKSPQGLTEHTFESAVSCFSNEFIKINDGIFVLVGDLPYDQTQKILSNYLGGFRVSRTIANKPIVSYKLKSGVTTLVEEGDSPVIRIGLAADEKYTPETSVAFKIAVMALRTRLSGAMSDIGYTVSAESSHGLYPLESVDVRFTLVPASLEGMPSGTGERRNSTDPLLQARKALLSALAQPLSAGELQSYRSTVANEYAASIAGTDGFVDAVLMRYTYGKDVLSGFSNKINAVSAENVKAVMDVLAGGMRVEYVVR